METSSSNEEGKELSNSTVSLSSSTQNVSESEWNSEHNTEKVEWKFIHLPELEESSFKQTLDYNSELTKKDDEKSAKLWITNK